MNEDLPDVWIVLPHDMRADLLAAIIRLDANNLGKGVQYRFYARQRYFTFWQEMSYERLDQMCTLGDLEAFAIQET